MRIAVPILLAALALNAHAATSKDPLSSYQSGMDKAMAEIAQQTRTGKEISLPTIAPTGSPMFDRAARIILQFSVDLNRETRRSDWQPLIFDEYTLAGDFTFLADPAIVATKYSRLKDLHSAGQRHLSAVATATGKHQRDMAELRAQYGKQSDVLASPFVERMHVQYPVMLNRIFDSYTSLIEYAHANAGRIMPADDGQVSMQEQADTIKILALIAAYEKALLELRSQRP